ncbi:hypothetical protein J1N35_044095 [Gossypium stocksii]|uniref:Uncharacterized protein n=1 Tax=Gossypium stocksii TaxID=47602 RepID=A0A9D3U8V4_9ROSI|nr:hypothetical protein J1N35_044095 [Gossypium stocksii]
MVVRANGEIESEEEKEEEPKALTKEEENLEYVVEGEILVIKQSLSLQSKVCSMIIDGGSRTNVASSMLVDKLGLTTAKHSHPYKLQWLNDGGELKVTKQAIVTFSIGKYSDEVVCDVVPMHVGHLLLGRLWQFD